MRLLYFYRYSILGGVSTQLANRLRAAGDKTEMHFAFLHDYGGRSVFGNHPWIHFPTSSQEMRALVRARSYDAVLVIDTPEAFPAVRDAGFTGAVINEVHTTTSNIAYLSSLHGERMSAFLAPSRYLCRRIEQEFGFAGEVACHWAPNCLDTGAFRPIAIAAVPRRKVLLWVGKLDDHKNWRGFLEAGRRLLDRRDDFELWLAGGETAPNPVAEEMLDVACELRLLDRLRWLQRVEYRAMPTLYSLVSASGGLTVSTSCDESFGMTVAESLACGCPAVAAAVGALPEILAGPLAAGLYPFFEEDALVATVEKLLDDAAERSQMAQFGRESIVERFGIEAAGSAYFEALRGVIGALPPSSGNTIEQRAG